MQGTTVEEGKPLMEGGAEQGGAGVAMLSFSPSRYVGLEESLVMGVLASQPSSSPTLPPQASASTASRRVPAVHDDAHARPQANIASPIISPLPLPTRKTSGEGGPPHTIRLSFLRHNTYMAAPSPVTRAASSLGNENAPHGTTGTSTAPPPLPLEGGRVGPSPNGKEDHEGGRRRKQEAGPTIPISTTFSDVSLPHRDSRGTTAALSPAVEEAQKRPSAGRRSPSLPPTVTLSQCLKEVQTTVTSSLCQVVRSVLQDVTSWWYRLSGTSGIENDTLLVRGSGRVRLYLTPSFAAPIRRVLALREQWGAYGSTPPHPWPSHSCSCTRITTEALLATCLSFCAYAIPRWLLEGMLQCSRWARRTCDAGGAPLPASLPPFSEPRAETEGCASRCLPPAFLPEQAGERAAAAAASLPSLVALSQAVLCKLSFLKERVREPTNGVWPFSSASSDLSFFTDTTPPRPTPHPSLTTASAVYSSSVSSPHLPVPSVLELKIMHHLLHELYRVVRRLCEVWKFTKPQWWWRHEETTHDADHDAAGGSTWSLLQCAPSQWFSGEKWNPSCGVRTDPGDPTEESAAPSETGTLGRPSPTASLSAETTIASGEAESIENRFLSTILVCIENWARGGEKEVAFKESEGDAEASLEKWREELRINIQLWKTLFFPSRIRK